MNIDEKIKKLGLSKSFINHQGQFEEIQPDKLNTLVELLDKSAQEDNQQVFDACYVLVQGDELIIQPNSNINKLNDVKLILEKHKIIDLMHDGKVVSLPQDMPFGYHVLQVSAEGKTYQSKIIYAPLKCHMPENFEENKIWGCALQLYTMRSNTNWGMGNLADLQLFAQKGAQLGMNVLGLNPMHLLYNEDGRKFSPYSPSSRILLDPKYIDWQLLPEAKQAMAGFYAEHERRIEELRAAEFIDYSEYSKLVFSAAQIAYGEFLNNADENRLSQFNEYLNNNSETQNLICLFQALYDHFYQQDKNLYSWQEWPAEFQDYQSKAVKDFAVHQQDKIRFYQFMQWVANQQLEQVQVLAKQNGMSLGLYRDLAVGVDTHGAETWMYGDIYNRNVSVGAPPDALALQGQNWSLPVMNPAALKNRAYQPFIQMVRANMQHAGALRIDHIMGLFRIWCMPANKDASFGTYIHYPLKDLLAILALESQRHQCMVIGEDLGVVPDEIRVAMKVANIYSYKVFLFERDGNELKAPGQYEEQALASLSTHDLPTMAGYWQSIDVDILDRLNLFPTQQDKERVMAERIAFKQAFVRAMASLNNSEMTADTDDLRMVVEQAHEYLASSKANITVLQPDDFLLMQQPVNLPGTTDQYPNWQRKLSHTVEAFFADEQRINHMKKLSAKRKQASI